METILSITKVWIVVTVLFLSIFFVNLKGVRAYHLWCGIGSRENCTGGATCPNADESCQTGGCTTMSGHAFDCCCKDVRSGECLPGKTKTEDCDNDGTKNCLCGSDHEWDCGDCEHQTECTVGDTEICNNPSGNIVCNVGGCPRYKVCEDPGGDEWDAKWSDCSYRYDDACQCGNNDHSAIKNARWTEPGGREECRRWTMDGGRTRLRLSSSYRLFSSFCSCFALQSYRFRSG